MILRRINLLRTCKKIYLKVPWQPQKIMAISPIENFSKSNLHYEFNDFYQKPKSTDIIGTQYHVISKKFNSSNYMKGKLRKDDDIQPELKEIPLKDGDFSLSQSHYDRKIHSKDIGRKFTVGESVITALNNVYGIERRIALTMMRSQKFLLVADSTILQTVYFLAKRNISPVQIQRIPWLLLFTSEALESKMDLLVDPHLFESIEDGLGFCYLHQQRIQNTKTFFSYEKRLFPNHRNRLYYMAEMLEVPVPHLTERIVKPHRVMSMDFKRIVNLLDLFKSYGVTTDDILRDLWIFFHNVERTEQRLRTITEAGCTRPRLWMCRCKDEVFDKSVKHYEDKKSILGGGSITVVEYLAEQLECPTEEIETHCATNTNLLRVRVSKMQSILEMLLAEGIKREAIRASPRILQHSEKKLKSRIDQLKALGYQPTTCPTLFKSQSKFDHFCENLRDHKFRMEYSSQDTSVNGIKSPWIKPTESSIF
ncbi:unnamed protein product, partial [Meganyctiphanes norvegica]